MINVDEKLYNEANETAQATGLGGDFARVALKRLVNEYQTNGDVMLGNPVVLTNQEFKQLTAAKPQLPTAEKQNNTFSITLTNEQMAEMSKVVKRYGITLEQACLYGFFNFEFRADPTSTDDGWLMIETLREMQNPDLAFKQRHKVGPGRFGYPTVDREHDSDEAA